jgi:hypothetical protein
MEILLHVTSNVNVISTSYSMLDMQMVFLNWLKTRKEMNYDFIFSTHRSCEIWVTNFLGTYRIHIKFEQDDCWLGQGCGAFFLLLGVYCRPP